jgi:hypothetical protein
MDSLQDLGTYTCVAKNNVGQSSIIEFHVKQGTAGMLKYDFLASYRDFSHEIPHKFSHLPPKLEKMIFLHKIVIFHTKYPKNFSTSLRSAQLFLSAPPLK